MSDREDGTRRRDATSEGAPVTRAEEHPAAHGTDDELLEVAVLQLLGQSTVRDQAAELEFVKAVNGHLSGSYTPTGILRWWSRPRGQLQGRSPAEWLGSGWDPNGVRALDVLALARALDGPMDTT